MSTMRMPKIGMPKMRMQMMRMRMVNLAKANSLSTGGTARAPLVDDEAEGETCQLGGPAFSAEWSQLFSAEGSQLFLGQSKGWCERT